MPTKTKGSPRKKRARQLVIEELLTTKEVAEVFRVSGQTVLLWGEEGLLPRIQPPGGQYRYRKSDILAILGTEEVILIPPVEARRILEVTDAVLDRWVRDGLLKEYRNDRNHRQYNLVRVKKIAALTATPN